jgi:magnesium-transporting ATPase (P-type)
MFRYMALYAAVQFSCSLQCNLIESYLSEYEFLWVDLLVVLPLSALLPQTRAFGMLSPRRPPASLLEPAVLASVFGQALICLLFQLAVRALVRSQCWFRPVGFQCCDTSPASPAAAPAAFCPPQAVSGCLPCTSAFKNIVPNYDNTALWHLANFQYLWLAVALAISRPFRQPQWTNIPFSVCWLALLGCTVALLFAPSGTWTEHFFELIPLPDFNFRWAILCLALLSGLTSFGLEHAIEEWSSVAKGSWRVWIAKLLGGE